MSEMFQAFYKTPLGHYVQQTLTQALGEFWERDDRLSLVSMGYPTPFLKATWCCVDKVTILESAYSDDHFEEAILTKNGRLPLPDESVDRLLMVHALEYVVDPRPILREAWRVLSGQGRMIVVIPNRFGLWAQRDDTPFGKGAAYTTSQMIGLLQETQFVPIFLRHVLYGFPIHFPFMPDTAPLLIERMGQLFLAGFSGVIMCEVQKQVYGLHPPSKQVLIGPPRSAVALSRLLSQPMN